ncbi:metallophosphoesterase [Pseudoflavonifractor phocaeensis]|uniref:metallophosphoesterase n=1 Tax=Pseudoflavonifractor phocaeensis TaxID=1870988 RepID=UPI001958DD4E|nr:metallophosphoesterase [Pseudoflavonifractor phocaeensis]MBM6723848.1 metallophosphoesterase [Pseudoflavonifractor phocaeensis]
MKKRSKKLLLAGGIAAALLVWAGLDTSLTVQTYTVESGKVEAPVRLALLTDLHSCDYGEGQRELLDAVEEQNPDLVLLGGDIVDDGPEMPEERALATVEALAERWPTYYVTGNHEYRTGRAEEIKELIAGRGAVVLEGTCALVTVGEQTLQICGVNDPAVGAAVWQSQLEDVTAALEGDVCSILLSHRPERVADYTGRGFDLVLSGHAHGGQWRIPLLGVGLIAPNQGLFPRYAGGTYNLEGTTLVVSRGLARESTRIPRLYNPPEVVMVDLVPETKK